MTVSDRVSFQIAFEGSAQYAENSVIGALHLRGLNSEVSVGALDSKLLAGRLKWTIPNKDHVKLALQATKQVDEISLLPSSAELISFTARVFSIGKDNDVEVTLENRPHFAAGESYSSECKMLGLAI